MTKVFSGVILAVAMIGLTSLPGAAQSSGQPNLDVVKTTARVVRDVEIGAAVFAKVGPLFRVTIPLSNDSKKAITLEYQVEWLDATGAPVSSINAWQTVFLDPSQHGAITGVAQRVDALNARLTIRDVGSAQ